MSVMLVFLLWLWPILFKKDEVFPHSSFSHLWWRVLFENDGAPTLPQLEIIGDDLFSIDMKKERWNDFSDKIYNSTFGFNLSEMFPSGFCFSAYNSGSFASLYLCWMVQEECGHHPDYSQQIYSAEIPLVTEDTSLNFCSVLCSTQGIKLDPNHKLGIFNPMVFSFVLISSLLI